MIDTIPHVDTEPAAQSLRSNIIPKIPDLQYNAYIEKFTSDLILPNEKTSTVIITDADKDDVNQTSFDSTALRSLGSVYSRCMLLNADLIMKFSNVKTKANYDLIASSALKTTGVDYTYIMNGYTAKAVSAGSIIEYEGGNPNPFNAGTFAPVCNVLNSQYRTIDVTIGSNSVSIQKTNTAVKDVEVDMRVHPEDFLNNHYDGALIPNKAINHNQYVIPEDLVVNHLNLTNIAGENKVPGLLQTKASFASPFPTLADVNNDEQNSLSTTKRGQMMRKLGVTYDRNEDGSLYEQHKGMESPNFTLNLDTGAKTQTPNSKKLFWFKDIAGNTHPSNISNCQEAYDAGYSANSLYWYTNGILSYTTTVITEEDEPDKITHTFNCEPAGQTLNFVLKIPNVISPINHQLLAIEHNSVFCNAGNLLMKMTRSNTYYDLIDYTFKFDQQWGNGTDKINLEVKTKNNTLRLNQYQNALLTPYTNKTCVLPFLNVKNHAKQSIIYAGKQTQTFRFKFDTLTEIPKYIKIWASNYNAVFKALRLFVDNNSDVLTNMSMIELYNKTRANGMINYTQFDNSTSYPNKWKKTNRTAIHNATTGSILFLQYGTDFGLGDAILAAGTKASVVYTLELDVEYDSVFGQKLDITIDQMYQSYYTIGGGGDASVINSSYTTTDVESAYKLMIGEITKGGLYQNVRRYFGGAVAYASKRVGRFAKRHEPRQEHKPKIYENLNATQQNSKSSGNRSLLNMMNKGGW